MRCTRNGGGQGRGNRGLSTNRHKDAAAFRAAEDYFKGKDNEAKRKVELQQAAEAGLPPPAPVVTEGGDPVPTYSWVEIGRTERATLGLNNASKGGQRWQEAWAADHAMPGGPRGISQGKIRHADPEI